MTDPLRSNVEELADRGRNLAWRVFLRITKYRELKATAIFLSLLGGPFLVLVGLCCLAVGVWMMVLQVDDVWPALCLAGLGFLAAATGAGISVWAFVRLRAAVHRRMGDEPPEQD